MNSPHFRWAHKMTTTKCFITTCMYYIDLMNDWQLLNNWFVNNVIHLEIINWSLTKYENTNI